MNFTLQRRPALPPAESPRERVSKKVEGEFSRRCYLLSFVSRFPVSFPINVHTLEPVFRLVSEASIVPGRLNLMPRLNSRDFRMSAPLVPKIEGRFATSFLEATCLLHSRRADR
jgi:hypothetical protein